MKTAHIKGKGQRPQPNKPEARKQSEADAYFSYNMAILVGCQAEVTTRDGEKYEGIFVAYSPAMEIMLEAAHLMDESYDEASISKHYDLLVIPSEKVLALKFQNVDLHYATRDFATDTAISSSRTQNSGDKELTPWDGADDAAEDLDLDTGGGQNGWEAEEMFKKNAEMYGVVSSFSQDLSGYTTKVDKSDESFRKQEEQASQIASEIEKNTTSWERTKVENGDDEEEAFSAVVRPRNNANHSSNNNNQSNVANDKYIPPSRRQQTLQPTNVPPPVAPSHPINNNGQSQMNNSNNSNNTRKPIYGQSPNPRNNYTPVTNSYHHERRNYDSRRGPPQNQYSHNIGGHGDGPGRRLEDGNRQTRVANKVPMERGGGDRRGGRDDTAKLKEFGNTFRLQNPADAPQNRRIPPNQTPSHAINMHMNSAPNPNNANAPNLVGRNPSPPSNNAAPPSSVMTIPPKSKKEEFTTVPAPPQPVTTSSNVGESTSGPINSSHTPTYSVNATNPSTNVSAMPNTPVQVNLNIRETTPPNNPVVGNDSQALNSGGDHKNGNDADAKMKKKFTFNPDAKEFAPAASKTFTPRSPSTPPRPPSTPATSNTPQLITAAPYHQIMPLPMSMLYAPPPYTHAQAALTPSSNSSASSGGTTPRHGGHRKGGGMLGVPPRSEMTPPMQMATGPPLLTPASLQATAPPAQYAFVPPGPYSQVMRVVPPNMINVYQSEAGGATQMHPPMHYLHHNGGTPQNNPGHPQNNSQSNNPSAQTSVVPANGHGYGQSGGGHGGPHHMGFPYVSVPVVGVSYPHGPQHTTIMTVPYVSHQGGGTAVIPQSQ